MFKTMLSFFIIGELLNPFEYTLAFLTNGAGVKACADGFDRAARRNRLSPVYENIFALYDVLEGIKWGNCRIMNIDVSFSITSDFIVSSHYFIHM